LSKRLTDTVSFTIGAGTREYMAPETLDYLSPDSTFAVDVWATGCIIYRLIAGKVPFPPGHSLIKYCQDGSNFPHDPHFDNGATDDGFDSIGSLLNAHPAQRPTAAQDLENAWLVSGKNRVSYSSMTT
jgi:serine/threonine protein kinase